jgi:hypothetical protein
VIASLEPGLDFTWRGRTHPRNVVYMVVSLKLTLCSLILAMIPTWGCPEAKRAPAERADGSQARYGRIDQLNGWKGVVVSSFHCSW